MKPSNPAKFFVTGSDEEAFVYEPGAFPYYVIIHSKHHILVSAMVFANHEQHVREILHDLVDFIRVCTRKRKDYFDVNGGYWPVLTPSGLV